MSVNHPLRECSQEGCDKSFKDSGYWSHIRIQNNGWFMMRDGSIFCPEHLPDWVPAWREKQRKAANSGDVG